MNLRPKTKRRLLVLVIGTSLVVGGGAAFVSIQLRRFDSRRMQFRSQAMNAYRSGDYSTALFFFHKYLINTAADPAAIYAYGVCRENVPTPDYQYLLESKSIFNRYLESRPNDLAAEHRLLDVYRQLGYDAESLDLADTILRQDSNDLPALQAKAQALAGQFQYEAGLALSQKINRLAPEDLQSQILTLQLMQALHRPSEQIVDRADVLLRRYPSDPHFQLLRAVAASMAGDLTGAGRWLRAAAAAPAPLEPQFTLQLCVLFERIGMYADATSLLKQSTAVQHPNADLVAALAQRQWESGDYASALQTLADVDPQDPSSPSRLLALRALSLFSRGAPSDASAALMIVTTLSQRQADPMASAWVSLLHARYFTAAGEFKQSIRLYESALVLDPQNAVARYFLGLVYRDLGESELAVQSWRRASANSPAWAAPHVEMARAFLADDRLHDAQAEAAAALARLSGLQAAQVIDLDVRYAELGAAPSRAQLTNLLSALAPNLARDPFQVDIFPIDVELLSRTGRKAAAEDAVRKAMAAGAVLQAEVVPKLALVCASQHLEVATDLIRWIDSAHPPDAAQAFQLARALAALGQSADGLKLLFAGDSQSPAWQLAIAQYRELIGDTSVGAAWNSLADSNPTDLAVARAILAANSTWNDRALIDRTIERLRKLTGEQAIQWRVARARWQLSSPQNIADSASAAAALMAEVVRIAPDYAPPLLLWAQALEKLSDIPSAISRLRSAAELSPDDPSIPLELSHLLQTQGNFSEAKETLDRLAQSPTAADRLAIGQMLAAQAEYDDAAKILTTPPIIAGTERDLLLAQCLRCGGKPEQAARIYTRLLRASDVNESVVRAAAWFYATHGQLEKSRAALDRIDAPLLSAEFDEDFGPPDSALPKFQSAAQANPQLPAVWMALAGYEMRRGDFAAASAAADEGLGHVDDSAELAAVKTCCSAFSHLPANIDQKDLIESLSRNPMDPAAMAALTTLAAARSNRATPAEALAELVRIADRYPQSLAVQILVARRCVEADQLPQAMEIAQRAVHLLPTEAEPPRFLCALYSTQGKWDLALTAALQWRARTLELPVPADIAVASIRLHIGDAAGAIQQISPYLDLARNASDKSADDVQVISLYAQALAQDGRWTDAQALLEPLAEQSLQWRIQWLDLSPFASDPAAAARWIDKISILLPADSVADQCALASAWMQIANRFNDPASFERARDILAPLSRRPDATPQVAQLLSQLPPQIHDPTADGK